MFIIPYIIIVIVGLSIMKFVISFMEQKHIEKSDLVFNESKYGTNFTRSIK